MYNINRFVVQEITKDVEGYLTVKNLMARPECNNRVSILVSILVSISRIIGYKLVRLFEMVQCCTI